MGKTFGDLPLCVDLDVLPRCSNATTREVQPDKGHYSADDLGERPSGFVLTLESLFDGEGWVCNLPLRNLPQGQECHGENNKASNGFQPCRVPSEKGRVSLHSIADRGYTCVPPATDTITASAPPYTNTGTTSMDPLDALCPSSSEEVSQALYLPQERAAL